MSDLIEPVGARLTLLNGPAFRAGLAAATDALQAFNDEQARAAELADASQDAIAAASKESSATVVDSSAVAADAVKAQAAATVEASGAITDAAEGAAIGVSAANAKMAGSATAAAAETKTAWTSAVATSTKILKYASVLGAVVIYEGVKKYMSFQQQMTQLAISAGVSKSQLPAFTKMAIAVSDATGMAAVSVGDMMYRIASANPKIKMTTQSMEEMVTQAGNLAVLTGGDPDTVARLYGAIVSNGLSLTRGTPALSYSTAGGRAINEWVLGAAGRGDITPAQLVAAMGTGLLPVAKTYGLSLNDIGAALDVLTPAMSAQSASTRLKTAIGMLGSPSQKAVEAAELVGGNATTMGGLLRTGGFTALVNYLANLQTKAMTGASFIGGGIYGAASGKYSGVSGAADFLKSLGYTNAGLISLLQTRGITGLKSLSSAQLQGLGFNAGMTGTQAAATVSAELIGAMFGGGRTGAAIMQLVNEPGVLANRYATIPAGETAKSYAQKLSVAYAEPIVVWHRFEAQLQNLTIAIGKDVTPALDSFLATLLKIGSWFGKNKWALEALGAAAGSIVAGAAIVKTISVGEKLIGGTINIGKYLLTGTSAATSGTALTGAAAALKLSAGSLEEAAASLMGRGPGLTPVGTPVGEGETAATDVTDLGVASAINARAMLGRLGLTAATVWATNQFVDPWIKKKLRSAQHVRTATDALRGLETGAGLGFSLGGPIGAVPGAIVGTGLGALYSLGNQNAYSKAIQSYEASRTISARFASQAALGVTAANFAQRAQVLGMSPSAIASVMGTSTTGTNWVGAQHAQLNDIASAAKKYSVTADSLKTAADDQKTATDSLKTGADTLNTASEQMLLAAQQWLRGAATIGTALSPGNIHALAVAGTKGSVARK
jgi:hypothetical protein